jgi:hypothetical protein
VAGRFQPKTQNNWLNPSQPEVDKSFKDEDIQVPQKLDRTTTVSTAKGDFSLSNNTPDSPRRL